MLMANETRGCPRPPVLVRAKGGRLTHSELFGQLFALRCFPFASRDYGKTPFLSLDYVKTPFSPHPEANENKAKDGIGDNAGPCEHLVYDLLQPDVVWRARTGKTALQVIASVRQDPNSTAAGVRLTAS